MFNEMKRILDRMDSHDENVMALKALLNAHQGVQTYMLRYKGKYLTYSIISNSDEAEFCNDYVCWLGTDESDPIWTATDLIVAVYNKYVHTEWYNSSMETTTKSNILRDVNPDEIEIVDSNGRVYNRKPLTLKIKAIIYDKIYNDHYYMHEIERDPRFAETILILGEQQYLLEEARHRYNLNKGKIKITGMSYDDLIYTRKQLVKEKGELVRAGKSVDKTQKKLDAVNKKINSYKGG